MSELNKNKISFILFVCFTLFMLNSCFNSYNDNNIEKCEKTIYSLGEISSYLGIRGELNGNLSGTFFLGCGYINGNVNGQINDTPKFFVLMGKNGMHEFRGIPIEQASIIYINDSTERRMEVYRKYIGPKGFYNGTVTGYLFFNYSDIYTDIHSDSLTNYTEVESFDNIPRNMCYSVDYSDTNDPVSKRHVGNGMGRIWCAVDYDKTLYYIFYVTEKDVLDLSKLK